MRFFYQNDFNYMESYEKKFDIDDFKGDRDRIQNGLYYASVLRFPVEPVSGMRHEKAEERCLRNWHWTSSIHAEVGPAPDLIHFNVPKQLKTLSEKKLFDFPLQ